MHRPGLFVASMLFVLAVPHFVSAQRPQSPQQMFDAFRRESEKMFSGMFGDAPDDQRKLKAVPVSIQEEQQLGKQLLDQTLGGLRRQKTAYVQAGNTWQYVDRLVRELSSQMANRRRYRRFDVYVVQTENTDARAFPGGAILISEGMLDFAPSEAALAGVLAHELSHIDRGHLLEGIQRQKLAQRSFSGGRSVADMMQASRMLMSQFARPFRPEQEVEADQDATLWLLQSSYDPREMADLFLKLHQRDQDKQQVQSFMPSFLRSHPFHLERRNAVQQAAKRAIGQAGPLYIGRRNLQERTTRSQRVYRKEIAQR